MKVLWLFLFLGCLQQKEVKVEKAEVTFTKQDSSELLLGKLSWSGDIVAVDTITSWRFQGYKYSTLFEFTLHPNDSISFELNPGVKMDEAAKEFFDYVRRGLKNE